MTAKKLYALMDGPSADVYSREELLEAILDRRYDEGKPQVGVVTPISYRLILDVDEEGKETTKVEGID